MLAKASWQSSSETSITWSNRATALRTWRAWSRRWRAERFDGVAEEAIDVCVELRGRGELVGGFHAKVNQPDVDGVGE
jgi:hypothetical protein